MTYNIIAIEKKEYRGEEYPTKYYVHTVEYPHIIQVDKNTYSAIAENDLLSFDLDCRFTVANYNNRNYYKYVKEV